MISDGENWLRAATFKKPQWIPCGASFAPLLWHTHREKLDDLLLQHALMFPGHKKNPEVYDSFPPAYRAGETFRDNWGCVWRNDIGGLEGQVVEHPLADWSALRTYQPPDPLTKTERGECDWDKTRQQLADTKKKGWLRWGNGERLFDRLYFLRGFNNLMMDFATDDPHLPELIDMLTQHEIKLVNLWLEAGATDVIGFHTDIGTQKALMISPAKFRQYIKPMFKRIFQTVRAAGALVSLSSDGCLLAIVDDLAECGVNVQDPQLRANTLEGIQRVYKGKLCINLDLDRQMFPFCTPEDIWNQVREAKQRLNSPEGGLMMFAAVYDDITPLKNIEALIAAMEELCLKPKVQG
ncbi:MAG: uroporphyrinogen decarboxylase family protein [Planctomycetota bacterium]